MGSRLHGPQTYFMLIKLEREGGCPRFVGAFPSWQKLKENRKSEEEGRPCEGLAFLLYSHDEHTVNIFTSHLHCKSPPTPLPCTKLHQLIHTKDSLGTNLSRRLKEKTNKYEH